MDDDGQVKDYAGDQSEDFSLSAYYDISSYGQHRITSYVTDWYAAPYNFAGDKDRQLVVDDQAFMEAIYAWLMETYPDMDWTRFDADADGFFDAVSMFDMQSRNVGDWNVYSKYAVGWIQPEVVTGLEPVQSVEIAIGELAATGDAIVILVANGIFDGSFGEYIIIDLMTDGVNGRDAAIIK